MVLTMAVFTAKEKTTAALEAQQAELLTALVAAVGLLLGLCHRSGLVGVRLAKE